MSKELEKAQAEVDRLKILLESARGKRNQILHKEREDKRAMHEKAQLLLEGARSDSRLFWYKKERREQESSFRYTVFLVIKYEGPSRLAWRGSLTSQGLQLNDTRYGTRVLLTHEGLDNALAGHFKKHSQPQWHFIGGSGYEDVTIEKLQEIQDRLKIETKAKDKRSQAMPSRNFPTGGRQTPSLLWDPSDEGLSEIDSSLAHADRSEYE